MKENSTQQFNLTTVGVTVLLFLSLITAGYFINTKGTVSQELNDEKLKSETFLSQKLQLEKEIEKIRKKLPLLVDKIGILTKCYWMLILILVKRNSRSSNYLKTMPALAI